MKNVIVTGGNGFIGSSLIKKLIEKGTRVVAVDITFHGNRLLTMGNTSDPSFWNSFSLIFLE